MKDYQKALKSYKQSKIISAPLEENMIILTEKALSTIKIANDAINMKLLVVQNRNLQTAQECILQLMTFIMINVEKGKELIAVYDYLNRQLIKANINSDKRILDEVSEVLQNQVNDWKIAKRYRGNRYRSNLI